VELAELQAWVDAYVRAWETNDPQLVASLFTEEARYFTHPFRDPWDGREAIVKSWTENPDPPGSWKADYRAIAATGQTGVVRGRTAYLGDDGSVDREYANVFIVEFDGQGRASEFTEFFMLNKPPPRT